jgi:cAMP-dependent protein kinase regulator
VSHPGSALGVWERLDRRLSLVTLRPRLSEDVRIRHIGEEYELVQVGTRRVLPLNAGEVEIVRRLDGERSIAEIIVAGIDDGLLAVEPVLSLVDRLVRAELLDDYPPHLYRQVVNHLRRIGDAAALPDAAAPPPEPLEEEAKPEPRREHRTSGPWRARSPVHAERARFLRGVGLLAGLDVQSIGALADAAHEEVWQPGSTIVSEGGRADRFFIVQSGVVDVQRREEGGGDAHALARLGPGDWFGEAALVDASPRNATVRAGDDRLARLLSFDADVFDRHIRPHVQMRDGRGSALVSRRRAQLEQVPLFRALAPQDLDRLARVLREVRAPRGHVLFRQGEQGDRFYVLIAGGVGVVKDGVPIAKLLPGEFFGETALLFTDERTATVAATEDSRFWVLDRDAFQTFVRDALLHRRDLMPTVLNRIGSTDPV